MWQSLKLIITKAKGISFALLGNLTPQVIAFISLPILSRLYGPESYGKYATYLAIINVLATVAGARFDVAIPSQKSSVRAGAAAQLAVFISLGVALAIFFLGWLISYEFGVSDFQKVLYVALGMFLQVCAQVATYWLIREESHGQLLFVRVTSALASVLCSVALSGFGSDGLILASMLSMLVVVVLFLSFRCREVFSSKKPLLVMVGVVSRLKYFPLKSTPAALLNALSSQAFILLAPIFMTPHQIGLLSQVVRLVQTPFSIFSSAVSQVFYRKISKAQGDMAAQIGLVKRTHGLVIAVLAAPVVALIFFGPELFLLILGANWAEAGVYAKILVPLYLMSAVAGATSTVLFLFQSGWFELKLNIALLLSLTIPLLLVGNVGVLGYMLVSGLSGALIYGFFVFWSYRRLMEVR